MSHYDRLAQRLSLIITKLNNAESFTIKELQDEFNVSKRTIQRDIQERLSFLPLKVEDGRYSLEEYYLGKLQYKDIVKFAALSGVRELFPVLDDEFIKKVLNDVYQSAYLVKGHNYEKIDKKLFGKIEDAVLKGKKVSFEYKDKKRVVEPYKLLNNKGIWYLAGVDDGKLKTFTLSYIDNFKVLDMGFAYDKKVDETLKNEDNIWFTQEPFEVVLKVSSKIAYYFKRRDIIPNQTIIKSLSGGGVLVSTKVGHENQILPIVRYWIPHIQIISPESLQTKLEKELSEYLKYK